MLIEMPILQKVAAVRHDPHASSDLKCHLPRLAGEAEGTRVLCRKTIFQTPSCFSGNADSSHFWLVVPETSVMRPR
jgi:hypothetical protein